MASHRADGQTVDTDPYGQLRPEDISSADLPVAMRGFERDAVKRKLRRVAESYATALRQRDRARIATEDANERAVAAEAEIHTSARNIAELTKRGSALESELANAQARITELDRALARAASEPKPAEPSADPRELERARERIAELERALDEARAERVEPAIVEPVVDAESAPQTHQPEDAGELLVSALRTAEALRAAVREEVQRTLKKARERAAKLERQAGQERRALEEARGRAATLAADAERVGRELESARAERDQAERDAELVRERVRVEAEHTLASLQLQRQRVQTLLGDALAALDEDTGDARDVIDDLAARLHPQAPDPA